MDATALLGRLDTMGIIITVDGEKLLLEPGSRVPPELVEDLRQHKVEVIRHLRDYRQLYPGDTPTDRELGDIQLVIQTDGVAHLYSHVIQDLVAFVRSDADMGKVLPGFVMYTKQELEILFGEDAPSQSHLRLIHEAKKAGGRILPVDSE